MIPNAVRRVAIFSARSFLGIPVAEEPPGSNAGFWVEMFQQRFGGKASWAWCMYFVQWCFDEAYQCYPGLMNPFDDIPNSKRGHVTSVWKHCISDQRFGIINTEQILNAEKIPQGSIYIISRPNGTGHTGIVVSHWQNDNDHHRDKIKAIEGNASDAVQRREYTLDELIDKHFVGVIC